MIDVIFVDEESGRSWERVIQRPVVVGDHIFLQNGFVRKIEEIVKADHLIVCGRHTMNVTIRAATKIVKQAEVIDYRHSFAPI